jgi:hypothetical protein
MDLRQNVLAINHDRLPLRRAKRDMQDGPLFGNVDLLACEHRINPRAKPGLVGQLQQQAQRFIGYAVLGVVEVESRRLGRQTLTPLVVLSKKLAQMQAADLLRMCRQALPGGKLGDRFRGFRHSIAPANAWPRMAKCACAGERWFSPPANSPTCGTRP